ncbi:MAG: rotamase, partial [Brevundimonas sp.]
VDEIRAAAPAEAAPLVEQIRPALTQQLVQDMVQSAAASAAARVRAESDLARARTALGLEAEATPAAR